MPGPNTQRIVLIAPQSFEENKPPNCLLKVFSRNRRK